MASGDYRWRIPSAPEISVGGDLHFDLFVEVEGAGATFTQVSQGHFTLVMPFSTFDEITSTGTSAAKKAAVLKWIKDQVTAKGLKQADLSAKALNALLPGGVWPASGITGPI